ncbi:hypothetical protein A2318_03900 [Candidatus Uhrbacteria bacterium RIFOXYB2_FULL_45_11]|uniref:Uncharacterized protein n=1 Tax=Candidatus Uhrbacteria bacterium RIFOXYB2_FULL_45_11 TaxID=1802421 RepID=A0A1F7W553_9BACT|nr:MAG: hypothetical protein A2318_03900 [Candidatus Uhrbacteria bacterium RIFOXYB2_FULL_45_11]
MLDPQSPWMFRRDEVDLLEEDIDDIYDLHQSSNGRIQTMEQAIISEQLDTEEQADAEFTMQMDLRNVTRLRTEKSAWEIQAEKMREEDDLECDVQRSPFYEQLFRFADEAFVYASEVYLRKDDAAEHAFRVRVNVKMVPIKCAIALSEELHDDVLSLALARKEFALAIVYLDRVLISFAFMAAAGDDRAQSFLKPGTHMKQILQQYLTRLLNNRRGGLNLYE